MILADSVRIHTTPDRVFAFFEGMADDYLRWHPDHLSFRWVAGRGIAEGVTFHFEERIAGKLLRKTVRLTRVLPGRLIEFAPTNRLFRLILPSIAFAIEIDGAEVIVRQAIRLRIGPLGAWLNRREFAAVARHMREEGLNMRRLLEGNPAIAV